MKKRLITDKKSKRISCDMRPHGLSEAIEIESKATTYLQMTNHGIWKLHGRASEDNNCSSSMKSHHGNTATSDLDARKKLSDIQEQSTDLV